MCHTTSPAPVTPKRPVFFAFVSLAALTHRASRWGRAGRPASSALLSLSYLLAVTLLFASGAAAQQPAYDELIIAVTDPTLAPVQGASVVLRNKRTGFERSASTDVRGVVVYGALEVDDSYEVSVLRDGFARVLREARAGQRLAIVLEPASLRAEVTIFSASRQDELRESLNTKVEVLTREQIRDTGYETVGEVLREVPGVLTRRGSEGSVAGEQIQGIDSRQVLVLFDGFPVIGARGIKRGVLNLDRQSTANLQQIEVVKGASSALFGSDAIGGVINMIPREATYPFEGEFRASGGNPGVFDGIGTFGFARQKLSALFTVEQHRRGEVDLTPATFDTTLAGFRRTDLFARPQYRITDKLKLTALFDGYWNRQTGRALGEEGNQFNQVSEEAQSYGLTADWQFNERGALQARAYFARWDEITRGQLNDARRTPLPDGNLFERLGQLDATLAYALGERQFLQLGAEWRTTRYRGINRLRDDTGHRADTRNLWAQNKISLTGRLTATLGLRFDDHSVFGSALSPKVAFNFRVADDLNLRAAWGRGYRAPDLGQLYYRFLNPTSFYQVIGNPNLRPEQSGSWQIGGEGRAFRRRLRAGVNLYRNDVRRLIESISLGFIATPAQLNEVIAANGIDPSFRPALRRLLFFYKNIADVRTEGVELDADLILPKGLSIGGAYTYLDARDRRTRLLLLSRNRHQGSVKLAYTKAALGLRVNLRGSFYSGWIVSRAATGAETVAPGFQLWDLYAAKTLGRRGIELYGAIDNLFDDQDPNTGRLASDNTTPLPLYRAEVGRTFRLGIRWSFQRAR